MLSSSHCVTIRGRWAAGRGIAARYARSPRTGPAVVRHCQVTAGCCGHPPSPCLSRARELLDAVVELVGGEYLPSRIHGDAGIAVELSVPAAWAAPREEEGAIVVELLDAAVAGVGDEDVPVPVHGDVTGDVE